MIKITKQDVERAIYWLEIEKFCCHALASALSGHHYESPVTTDELAEQQKIFFIHYLREMGFVSMGVGHILICICSMFRSTCLVQSGYKRLPMKWRNNYEL